MTLFADILSSVFERRVRFSGGWSKDDRSLAELTTDLIGTGGEGSGLNIANRILDTYQDLDIAGKMGFFLHLARDMNIDPDAVRQALAAYEDSPGKATYRAFMSAAEPASQEVIRRLNRVPGGTEVLVRMRADLLRLGKDHPDLQALDVNFRHLFVSWFNRGFLVLRPISWESPAHILDKIIAYEAVHAIHSWDDLRRRLQPEDRRCFAFFHPAMPDEPLIFVEVALAKGVPKSIDRLLAQDRETLAQERADTAVFYSISNCQPGLAGISFGNSLIKQVARDLAAELPQIRSFVTLSPIPGLVDWLDETGISADAADPESMRKLAAQYLLHAKRPDGLPRDPVARFHLGNGALVHAVHAKADASEKGRAQSGGTMVNYLYDLARLSENHEGFIARQPVPASSEVRTLANSKTRPAG
ncbi:MAG: malonyl-CoA decarboxylase [Pseudomonadota bacterium]